MADKSTLADQLGWCITTRDALQELEYSLVSAANSYDATIETLRNTQVFGEYSAAVEQRQELFRQSAKALFTRIRNNNLEYINRQSKRIRQELGKI